MAARLSSLLCYLVVSYTVLLLLLVVVVVVVVVGGGGHGGGVDVVVVVFALVATRSTVDHQQQDSYYDTWRCDSYVTWRPGYSPVCCSSTRRRLLFGEGNANSKIGCL